MQKNYHHKIIVGEFYKSFYYFQNVVHPFFLSCTTVGFEKIVGLVFEEVGTNIQTSTSKKKWRKPILAVTRLLSGHFKAGVSYISFKIKDFKNRWSNAMLKTFSFEIKLKLRTNFR